MSNRDSSLYIIDILIAVDKINRYSKNFKSSQELLHSDLEWDASIRELQLIGDAINELLKMDLLDSSYRRIVDFRNQIVHGYFGIDDEIVWNVIKNKLPSLFNEILAKAQAESIELISAINASKIENTHNDKTIEFLNSLIDRIS